MNVHVDSSRRHDEPLGVANRGGRSADEIGVDAVHGRRIARLADSDDSAVLDPHIALDDADHRIDDESVAQQHVERAHGAVVAGHQPEAVAQGLSPAMQAFFSGNSMIMLNHRKQRCVAEPNGITGRRPVHTRVVAASHDGHGVRPL